MYAIQTHDLTKIYGKKHAVDHLNMTVHEGDIYGFVGNNGAGKSTTMKMIAGLASPTWGEIELYGQLIGARTRQCRRRKRDPNAPRGRAHRGARRPQSPFRFRQPHDEGARHRRH